MKLIILSLDAVGFNDILQNKNLFPRLHSIMENGTLIKKVKTITPSLTYPIHTTIITGEYPDVHGIDHNVIFEPFQDAKKWNWHYKNIKTPTLIDYLSLEKKSATSIFWPVTAGAKIHRCIPEIWDYKTGKAKASLLLKNGTIPFIVKDALKHRKLLNGKEVVALDSFTYNVFTDIIKSNTLSDLSLIHFLSVDGAKHIYGNHSVHAKNAFITLDSYVGNIYDMIKDDEDITLAILSDHTHIDSPNRIDIDTVFKEHGLLYNADYIAYPRTSDGSCYVHLKNKSQKQQIENKLRKLCTTTKGIRKLYDLEIEKNISSDASFLMDAEDGYCFVFNHESNNVGEHGHHIDRENFEVFLALYGKNIKKNFVVEKGSVINHAKTFAKILDIDFEHGPGEVVEEIFED